jgi:hypothetical protein
MKDLVFRALPIVVGVAIGWLVVAPPEFLGLPWWARVGMAIPAAAIVLLGVLMLLIGANLPADVSLKPVDQRRVSEQMIDMFNAYQAAGFQLAGPPLEVGVTPPAILVPLVDGQARMYGTIFRTQTDPPKTACDIVTVLEPFGGLTTGALAEGAALPAAPGSFYQVIPGADITTLRDKHVEALAFLERQGLRCKPATAESFPGDFKAALARARKHFWSNPFWYTMVVFYRSTTGNTPHMGALANQAVAQASLRKLREA